MGGKIKIGKHEFLVGHGIIRSIIVYALERVDLPISWASGP